MLNISAKKNKKSSSKLYTMPSTVFGDTVYVSLLLPFTAFVFYYITRLKAVYFSNYVSKNWFPGCLKPHKPCYLRLWTRWSRLNNGWTKCIYAGKSSSKKRNTMLVIRRKYIILLCWTYKVVLAFTNFIQCAP